MYDIKDPPKDGEAFPYNQTPFNNMGAYV